jgi:hypothetical protein
MNSSAARSSTAYAYIALLWSVGASKWCCALEAACFAPMISSLRSSQHRGDLQHGTRLFQVKNTRKGDSQSGGGGFGTPSDVKDIRSNLRSISGQHAGAGSKTLRKAALTFDSIRKTHGKEASHDVYVRSPLNSPTTFWFVGKVAVDPSGPTPATAHEACLAQKRIILEYAKTQLRPQNLGGRYGTHLELWLAPGDSEMEVVQNKITQLDRVSGSAADLPQDFDVRTVGFNPEIYVGDEVTKGGLRVERDDEGRVIKPFFGVNQAV